MRSLNLVILLSFFFATCQNSTSGFNSTIDLPSTSGIILSCVRCTCIADDLKKYIEKHRGNDSYAIYGDTNCLKKISNYPIVHLPQKKLDSIYERNYNMIFFRSTEQGNKFRLIKTEESADFEEIAKSFFSIEPLYQYYQKRWKNSILKLIFLPVLPVISCTRLK